MMIRKAFLSFYFFTILFIMTETVSLKNVEIQSLRKHESHDLILGKRHSNDRLVYTDNVRMSASSSSLSSNMVHVLAFSTFDTINYIEALDHQQDGRGGYARLVDGGPGYHNVNLYFYPSKNGTIIDFTVKIYAIANNDNFYEKIVQM